MDETLEYWENCIAQFEEALEAEMLSDEPNDMMLKHLKEEIEDCKNQIALL